MISPCVFPCIWAIILSASASSGVRSLLPPRLSAPAARARLIEAGGASEGPIVPMEFGRWAYATDPDGNSIGLFEFAS